MRDIMYVLPCKENQSYTNKYVLKVDLDLDLDLTNYVKYKQTKNCHFRKQNGGMLLLQEE
jgi:hypothetical protein